jgi:hypothetical protein
MPTLGERLQHAWNAFRSTEPTPARNYGPAIGGYGYLPNRRRLTRGNERSIVTAVYNRIAIDCAMIELEEVVLDQNRRYIETVHSGLTNCLMLDANLDQTGFAFKIDAVLSLFDEGVVALVPVDTNGDPYLSGTYDILTIRAARVVQWYPRHVRLSVYNENTGQQQEVTLPKSFVGIVENPFYAIMNEPNSTLQRLIRKLNLLDYIDEQSGSGKLDLIIQLPYAVKTPQRKELAAQRRKELEEQLNGSKYGVAWTDGTEKITQLNRPIENNIWQEVKDLTAMLYSQLGLTEGVFDGSADEKTMKNYYSRTVEPILKAFSDEMERKFLTKNARTRGHAVRFFRDHFKLASLAEISDIADKLISNEVAEPNEIRSEIGWKPSQDPRADQLGNRNLKSKDNGMMGQEGVYDQNDPNAEYEYEEPEEYEEEPIDGG